MTDKEEKEQPLKMRNESIDIEALNVSLNDLSGGHMNMNMNHNIGLMGMRSEAFVDMSFSSALDDIVKNRSNSTCTLPMNLLYRKESDASALLALAGAGVGRRKESDASALDSLSSTVSCVRKDSDVSALSALMVKDEEEMMQHDEEAIESSHDHMIHDHDHGHLHDHDDDHLHDDFASRATPLSIRKESDSDSDPFGNLRKLSDASDAVSALRKMSEESALLKNFRKDSDGTLGDGPLGDFKSPESAVNILGEMKFKDDASVHLFENPNPDSPKAQQVQVQVQPTPVFKKSTPKYTSLALEHLDMLGTDNSEDGSSSTVTMNETNQRLLMEAMLGTGRNRSESWGGMSDISANQMARIESLASAADISTADIPQVPSQNDFEGVIMSPRSNSQDSLTGHLQQVEEKKKRRRSTSSDPDLPDRIGVPLIKGRERLDSLAELGRDRLDSMAELHLLLPKSGRDRAESFSRDRLDSWTVRDRKDSIATRDRLDSLANLSGIFSKGRDRLDTLGSLGEVSLSMMSLGDLEDVAGKLESIVHGDESDTGDSGADGTGQPPSKKSKGALPAPTIHVDSDAVQSAVMAAMAATSGGILDMLQINTPAKGNAKSNSGMANSHNAHTPLISNSKIKADPSNSNTEVKMEEIRARARAAAGYVHPGTEGAKFSSKSRKRPLPNAMHSISKRPTLPTQFSSPLCQPKLAKGGRVPSTVYGDLSTITPKRKSYAKSPASSAKGGQSNQKWEEMFECLVNYVKEQKAKETGGISEEDAIRWEWTGNVPTMYKTNNGKALGRWINNQRSAKSKGSLKPEREQRLVGTGLKWSVLTTNAWTDMMDELKLYVKEKTKDGKKWDGNVPTNYKIKTSVKPDGTEIDDEDKNLGRWINRQRSLYQAGKLKDDRRQQLELIGLKWAVLSTTSWHTMYESLVKYANTKREMDKNKYWDGNVPASYETDDKPPKKLGRWVNRQRSAYANKKLKKEFVEKLETAGLKWTAMDSKKDLENSEVLMRQRSMIQTQRPIIRTVPQIGRPGIMNVRPPLPGARPVISGSRPGVVTSGVRSTVQGTPGARPGVLVSGVRPVAQGTLGVVSGVRPVAQGTLGARPGVLVSGVRPVAQGTVGTVVSGVRPVIQGTVGARPVAVVSGVRPVAQGTVGTVVSGVRPFIQGTVGARPVAVVSGVRQVVQGTKPVQQKQIIRQGIQIQTSASRVVPSTVKPRTTANTTYSILPSPKNGVSVGKPTIATIRAPTSQSFAVPTKITTPVNATSRLSMSPGKLGTTAIGLAKSVPVRTSIQSTTAPAPNVLVQGRTAAPLKSLQTTVPPSFRVPKVISPQAKYPPQVSSTKVAVPAPVPKNLHLRAVSIPNAPLPTRTLAHPVASKIITGVKKEAGIPNAPLPTRTLAHPVASNSIVDVKKEAGILQATPQVATSVAIGTTSTPAVGSTNVALNTKSNIPSATSKESSSMVCQMGLKSKNFVSAAATQNFQKTMPGASSIGSSQINKQKSTLCTPISQVAQASKVTLPVQSTFIPKVSSSISTTSASSTSSQVQAVTTVDVSSASNTKMGT